MELPLLRVILDSGGELRMKDAVRLVTTSFPNITSEDLERRVSSGGRQWTNRVRWARQNLVSRGELDKSTRGIWKITEKGRLRLQHESRQIIPIRETRLGTTRISGSGRELLSATLVKDEENLYDPALNWLNANWGREVRDDGDEYWIRVTATKARKGQLGKWSRPDLTSIQVSRFDVLPERSIEVSTFEVKRFSDLSDLASVYEAASHQRWSHYTYLVVEVPNKEYPIPEYLISESARFGVGLLKMFVEDTSKEYELEESIGPRRQSPEPKELDRMLLDFFSNSQKELRRFKDLIK